MSIKSSNLLLDSDVIIDLLKGVPFITDFVVKIKEKSNLYYSPLSKVEVYAGAFENEYGKIGLLFSQLRSIDITDPIGEKAGML